MRALAVLLFCLSLYCYVESQFLPIDDTEDASPQQSSLNYPSEHIVTEEDSPNNEGTLLIIIQSNICDIYHVHHIIPIVYNKMH